MKKNTTFMLMLLCFLLALYSCGDTAPAQEDKKTTSDIIELPVENPSEEPAIRLDYTLEGKRAGDFELGALITPIAEQKGYTIEKRSKMVEGEAEPYYIISGDGEALLQVSPQYNLETQGYEDVVGRIIVLSSRYKMSNGLGVGSSIEEVQKMYADTRLLYSSVGDLYILETPQVPVQFLLSEHDFVGAAKKMEGESTVLELTDFKTGSKVSGIRIF